MFGSRSTSVEVITTKDSLISEQARDEPRFPFEDSLYFGRFLMTLYAKLPRVKVESTFA